MLWANEISVNIQIKQCFIFWKRNYLENLQPHKWESVAHILEGEMDIKKKKGGKKIAYYLF